MKTQDYSHKRKRRSTGRKSASLNASKKVRPHKSVGRSSRCFRSKVTNGSVLLRGDKRTAEYRFFRDTRADVLSRIGDQHRLLAEQIATLALQKSLMDCQLCAGKLIDPLALARVCNSLDRQWRRVSVIEDANKKREADDDTIDPLTYARQRYGKAEAVS